MIEIIPLLLFLGAVHETAKRRGVKGWPFLVVGLVGWRLLRAFLPLVMAPGPDVLLAWSWVGLTYASIFLIGGGGRRMKDSWQCPDCRFYNTPTTLVCLCGYKPEAT